MSRQVKYLYRDDVGGVVDVSTRQATRILKQLPGAERYDGVHYRVRDCQEVRVALVLFRQKNCQRAGTKGNDWMTEFQIWKSLKSRGWKPLPRLYGANAYRQLAADADRLLDQMDPVREFYEEVQGWRRQALAAAQKRSASPRGTARR